MTKKHNIHIPRHLSPATGAGHSAELSNEAPVKMLRSLSGLDSESQKFITDERRNRAKTVAEALQVILAKNKEIEEAHVDSLTGLPDRFMFENRIRQVIERESRSKVTHAALSIVDANGVKRVNEARGHKKGGDPYIAGVAKAIISTLRPEDSAYRIGGDELAVIRLNAPSDLNELNTRLKTAFHDNAEIKNLALEPELYTGISVGTERYAHGLDHDEWYVLSDIALAADKAAFNATIPSEVLAQDPRRI